MKNFPCLLVFLMLFGFSCVKDFTPEEKFIFKINKNGVNIDVKASGILDEKNDLRNSDLFSRGKEVKFKVGWEPVLRLVFSKPVLLDEIKFFITNPPETKDKKIKLAIEIYPSENVLPVDIIPYEIRDTSRRQTIDIMKSASNRLVRLLKYSAVNISVRSNEHLGVDKDRIVLIKDFQVNFSRIARFAPSMDLDSVYRSFIQIDRVNKIYKIEAREGRDQEILSSLVFYALSGDAGAEKFFLGLNFDSSEQNHFHSRLVPWYEMNKRPSVTPGR